MDSLDITEKHLFRKKTKSLLSKTTKETIWNEFLDLKGQCGIIKFLVSLIPTNQLVQWQKSTSSLPNNIVKFAWCYLIYSLSNGTNLQKWKQKETSNCLLINIMRLSFIYLITAQPLLNGGTCPFETNLLKSYDYKVTKYQSLRSALLNTCSHLKLILLEISSLGFTRSSIKTFETYLNGKNLDSVRIIKKMSRSGITSFILHLLQT